MPAELDARRWRRFLRFSMRGLIVLVLVIGIGMGWLVRSAHIQRDAVAAIRQAGGAVKYDWEWSNGNVITGGEPSAPSWLVDRIGVDYFGHVTIVGIYPSSTPTDEAVEQVGRLSQLQKLNLGHSSVDDAGLEHLGGLRELTSLGVNYPRVTDAGLVHLKGLTNLEVLDLSDAHVSDLGLVHLGALSKLVHLDLSSNQISDAGLSHLKRLSKLRHLNLRGTDVSALGIEYLRRALPSMKIIR